MPSYGGVSSSGEFHHRSHQKSSHKPFKGKSKGKQERANRGKVDKSQSSAPQSIKSHSHALEGKRNERVNKSKQLQQKRREELIKEKRIGSRHGPPKIVSFVALDENIPLGEVIKVLKRQAAASLPLSSSSSSSPSSSPSSPLSLLPSDILQLPSSIDPHYHEVPFFLGKKKKEIIFYETKRELINILDAAKVSDVIVFLVGINGEEEGEKALQVDKFGQQILATLKEQGLPSVLLLSYGAEEIFSKKMAKIQNFKKNCLRFVHTAFQSDTKVVHLEKEEEEEEEKEQEKRAEKADPSQFFRWIGEIKLTSIKWRDRRTYFLSSAAFFDESKKSLFVFGFLRGNRHLDANGLVHLTGYGDFQVGEIRGREEKEEGSSFSSSSSSSLARSRRGSVAAIGEQKKEIGNEMAIEGVFPPSSSPSSFPVLHRSSPSQQETLQGLQEIDEANREQSIIHDEEMGEERDFEEDDDDIYTMKDEMDEDFDEEEEEEEEERRKALEKANQRRGKIEEEKEEEEEEEDDAFGAFEMEEEEKPEEEQEEEEEETLEEQEKRQLEYPDEEDFTVTTVLRERLAKYRGLKSFAHSPWDSKESLPFDYAKIFSFANFSATQHNVVRPKWERVKAQGEEEMQEGEAEGEPQEERFQLAGVSPFRASPVLIELLQVPAETAKEILGKMAAKEPFAAAFPSSPAAVASPAPLCLFSLFQHERKVSVLHFRVQRHEEDQQPLKSKTNLLFNVGYRRWIGKPLFSAFGKEKKHLVKKFLHRNQWMVASVYGRVQFPPAPVLIFRLGAEEHEEQQKKAQGEQQEEKEPQPSLSAFHSTPSHFVPLLAAGSLLSIDPDRLLIKRVVLTGHLLSVHKRYGVVRHMFFNAEDVNWFRPVELYTKQGLAGRVTESRGTKGHFKALFDSFVKQNDTVCMSLYKRQFPKMFEGQFEANL